MRWIRARPKHAANVMSENLLAISALSVRSADRRLALLRGLDLHIKSGEIIGLAGESGSGKTLTGLAVMGLLPPGLLLDVASSIVWRGRELVGRTEREFRALRGREIARVPQHPMTALNPIFPVGRQLGYLLKSYRGMNRAQARSEATMLLGRLGIPEPERLLKRYPHELSGGTCQRVLIAMSMACRPRLIIADEITSALDVTTQATILECLTDLCRETGTALLLITHDLGIIARSCDRAAVMYCGRIVEEAPVEALYARPRHPYSAGLLAAVPVLDRPADRALAAIAGQVPDPLDIPSGCAFAPRCPRALAQCGEQDPGPTAEADRHYRCFAPLV